MSAKEHINIIFKTRRGTECHSYAEASLTDTLECGDCYLQTYQIKAVVATLINNFFIKERKMPLSQEMEEQNEAV